MIMNLLQQKATITIRPLIPRDAEGWAARVASGVVDCLLLVQEHGLNTGTLVHLPAVSEWSDFDDCHNYRFAFSSKRP
jgi:hypothetical protein